MTAESQFWVAELKARQLNSLLLYLEEDERQVIIHLVGRDFCPVCGRYDPEEEYHSPCDDPDDDDSWVYTDPF